MKTVIQKTTTTNIKMEISARDILDALVATGKIPKKLLKDIAQMYVHVPGGGDWSNTELDLFDHSVFIQITQSITE